jgi:hypothetical protein
MEKTLFDVFSFWIFIWFLLFYMNIIPFNPLFFLIICLLLITISGFYMIYNTNITNYNKIKFIIINFLMKFIPIILIIQFPLVFYLYDIYFGICLIIIYLISLKFMHKNVIQIYKELYLSNINDNYKNYRGAISKFYDNIYSYLFNYYIK